MIYLLKTFYTCHIYFVPWSGRVGGEGGGGGDWRGGMEKGYGVRQEGLKKVEQWRTRADSNPHNDDVVESTISRPLHTVGT